MDSKRDVDQELKRTCEEYIHHVTELFVSPLQMFLSRVSLVVFYYRQYLQNVCVIITYGGRRGRDPKVAGFTTTCAISAYHY